RGSARSCRCWRLRSASLRPASPTHASTTASITEVTWWPESGWGSGSPWPSDGWPAAGEAQHLRVRRGGRAVADRWLRSGRLAGLPGGGAGSVLATASGLRGAVGRRGVGPARAGGPEPGGRAVLLMNPRSGGGKVERFRLADEARRRGIEPMVLSPGDDLQALAREAAGRAEVIGMAGGDGSQALVAQVAMARGIPFVCVPAGTRNHLAQDLG